MTAKIFQSDLPELLTSFSRIGCKNVTGLERLALSDVDGEARSILRQQLADHNLHYYSDKIGNQFGLVRPWEEEVPLVLVGSHLDSQPDGGRFDGQVGVLAALLVVSKLRKQERIPEGINLGVVNWTNEEGARFQPSVMGSSVFTGQLDLERALESIDIDGVSVADEIRRLPICSASRVFPSKIAGYAELHVEQSDFLEEEHIDIGIVDGTWAAYKVELEVCGVQTHTGPTPMKKRVDAMYAAARLITFIHDLGIRREEGDLHTSVAWMDVYPNSPNATPSSVKLKVELRSMDEELLRRSRDALEREMRSIEKETHTCCRDSGWSERTAMGFDAAPLSFVETAISDVGLSHKRMKTVAGHDAVVINAARIPSILLFIPSSEGITHNSLEYTADEDLAKGEIALEAAVQTLLGFVEEAGIEGI